MIRKCLRNLIYLAHTRPLQERKFYPGQGGKIKFCLTKGNYLVDLETVWEDHVEMEVSGGLLTIEETTNQIRLQDEGMKNGEDIVNISLKIPQDYTLDGTICGSLKFNKGVVDTKLRSQSYSIQMISQSSELSLPFSSSERVSLSSQKSIQLGSLTCITGLIKAPQITAKKIMLSESLQIIGKRVLLRSLINFAQGISKINSEFLEIQSLSGHSKIQSPTISIDRIYAGSNIDISTKTIMKKMKIETGSGQIVFPDEADAFWGMKMIELGRMHKGSIKLNCNKVQILNSS